MLVFGLGVAFLGHFWLPVHFVSTSVPICDMKFEAFPCSGHTNIYVKWEMCVCLGTLHGEDRNDNLRTVL